MDKMEAVVPSQKKDLKGGLLRIFRVPKGSLVVFPGGPSRLKLSVGELVGSLQSWVCLCKRHLLLNFQ